LPRAISEGAYYNCTREQPAGSEDRKSKSIAVCVGKLEPLRTVQEIVHNHGKVSRRKPVGSSNLKEPP
jgi:hypothetical protein